MEYVFIFIVEFILALAVLCLGAKISSLEVKVKSHSIDASIIAALSLIPFLGWVLGTIWLWLKLMEITGRSILTAIAFTFVAKIFVALILEFILAPFI